MKKIIPALALLLVSAVLLATSSFAWFSMNSTVTVTGMEVKTKVTSNLLISPNATEANFTTQLSQAKNALVEPVSTIDGKAFYYTSTSNVLPGGDARTDAYTLYNAADTSAFNTAYGTTGAVGYVDYTFYIKATSTEDNSKVALTKCNLLYNGAAVTEKAWRVAVFANVSADNAANASGVSTSLATAKTILTPASATNFTGGKAVSSTSALDTVTYNTAAVIDADIDAGISRYYYITVRLWLEGEDNTCNVETFAALTNKYTLDLDFQIDTGATGVTAIGTTPSAYTYATVDSTAAGVTLTDSKLSNGATPSAYEWHKVSDDSVVGGATTNAAPAAGATAVDYYCIITATDGNVYRTGTVTVDAAP